MIKQYKVLSIIPCRAGSRGLPGKNYKDFFGKPLFYWSLDASTNSKYVDLTIISTNDQNVQGRAYSYMHSKIRSRIKCLWRPEEISSSTSKSEETLIHVSKELKSQYDIIIMLQPTSPIRERRLLDDALEKMIDNNKKSLMTVSEHTPFFVKKENDDSIQWLYDPKNRPMRQEIDNKEIFFHDDGCLYCVFSSYLLKNKCRLDNNPYIYINNKYSSCQIDTIEDFNIMESICKVIGNPLI